MQIVTQGFVKTATEQGNPFLSGPTFAGTYHTSGDPASSAYTYGRYHNPTWIAYEKAITELEGGRCYNCIFI